MFCHFCVCVHFMLNHSMDKHESSKQKFIYLQHRQLGLEVYNNFIIESLSECFVYIF